MIIIDENYRINGDSKQWILEEKRITKDKNSPNFGKENWDSIGFFSELYQVFQRLLDMRLKELPTMELKVFLKEAKNIKQKIKDDFDITA